MPMLRPWWIDLAAGLAPLLLGAVIFLGGMRLNRCSRRVQLTATITAIALLVAVAILCLTPLQDSAGGLLYHVGGAVQLAVWPACLLAGMAVGSPQRSWSRCFSAFLILFLSALLLMGGGGRIVWRSCSEAMWSHGANAEGALKQSNPATCVAASGVMLLHRHGIETTEAELAYQMDTSLFGTNVPVLAYSLNRQYASHGWKAVVQRVTYDECKELGTPFIAEVTTTFGIRRHAIFVIRLADDHAEVIDPLRGQRELLQRAAFERKWTGRIVRLLKSD